MENQKAPTLLEQTLGEYIRRTSTLFLSQDIRAQDYDLTTPTAEINNLQRELYEEVLRTINQQQAEEVQMIDNHLGDKFPDEWATYRDTRLKELADERAALRPIS